MAATRSISSVSLLLGVLLACRPGPAVSPAEPSPTQAEDVGADAPEPDDPREDLANLDTDADGIPDAEDLCPSTFGANASPDIDEDGIPDAEDLCPCDSEDFDGIDDDDGCPDICELRLDHCAVRIEVVIQFAAGDADIDATGEEALEEVRKILMDNPDITVEIRGHTDNGPSVGGKLDKLSDHRARRVRDWLIDHGISADRLIARGYSEEVPIDTNRTAEGRARNRRVDFVRTDNPACAP